MEKLKNCGDSSPLFVHHGLHLDDEDVASMSDSEIRTLINTVTNLNKSKMFAGRKGRGPVVEPKAASKAARKERKMALVEEEEERRQRSQSIDSVRRRQRAATNDNADSPLKRRPFSISGIVEDDRLEARNNNNNKDKRDKTPSSPGVAPSRRPPRLVARQTPPTTPSPHVTPTTPMTSPSAEFRSFVVSDAEHARADSLMCVAERVLAFRALFADTAVFRFDDATRRVGVDADRFSSRAASLAWAPALHRQALDVLAARELPECRDCDKNVDVNDLRLWRHSSLRPSFFAGDSPTPDQRKAYKRILGVDYASLVDNNNNSNSNNNNDGSDTESGDELPLFLWAYAAQFEDLRREETMRRILAEFEYEFG